MEPELLRPLESVEKLELARLGWMHWHWESLEGYVRGVPPAEFEEGF